MFSFGKKDNPKKPVIRKSLPVLIVNKNWHDLFSAAKPGKIRSTEKKLEALLKKNSQLKQEIKEYEVLKKQLMDGIIADMEHISEEAIEKVDKKMNTNSNLIMDLNSRIETTEDVLLDLPSQIDECNKELAFQTAEVFYEKLIANTAEYEEYVSEIEVLKKALRKKLEKKVDLEEENSAIYHKLHQVLGAEVIDQMDEYFLGKHMYKKSYDLKNRTETTQDSSILED